MNTQKVFAKMLKAKASGKDVTVVTDYSNAKEILAPRRVWLLQRALSWSCMEGSASPFILQRSVQTKGAGSATLKLSHLN